MQKKVKELFETMQGVSGLVGGAVALIRNGKVDTWFFGHSDRETGLPVSEETYFDIAYEFVKYQRKKQAGYFFWGLY